ncbi:MAG: sugar phosphate isomerase/epimerase family protein [Christensenellales bacterium]|jgi:3-dehydroshikimate dehydratase
MTPGLVSVTFREKTVAEICDICARAGLKAIEWGGDVHVPPGDLANARAVRARSLDAGLSICAYGSYHRIGAPMADFMKNLDAACELGSPAIRVWLGKEGSAQTDADARAALMAQLRACCDAARARSVIVAPEFHVGTLTDAIESVRQLLDETRDVENLRFYWQPRWDWAEDARLESLALVATRLMHVHAFTWWHAEGVERLALKSGAGMWKKALAMLEGAHILLEFVREDSEDALLTDARTLISWIGGGI